MKKRIGTAVIFTILLFFMFSSITVFGKLKKNVGKGYDLLENKADIVFNSDGTAVAVLKGKVKTKKGSYTYSLKNGKLRIKNSKGKVIFKKERVKQVLAGKKDCYYIEERQPIDAGGVFRKIYFLK